MLGAGAAVAFFGHIFGDHQVGFGESLIGQGGEAVEACHGLGDQNMFLDRRSMRPHWHCHKR